MIRLLPRSESFNLAIRLSKRPRRAVDSDSRNLSLLDSRNLSHLWRGGLDEEDDDEEVDLEDGGKLKRELEMPGVSRISPEIKELGLNFSLPPTQLPKL